MRQETKLTYSIYTRRSSGYKVVATSAPSRHRGDVALFYWDSPDLSVEAIRQFVANVISCHLVTGERQWYILGCYLAPGDDKTLWDMEAAMADRTNRAELIVVGFFNVDFKKTGGWGRDEEIMVVVAMAMAGL